MLLTNSAIKIEFEFFLDKNEVRRCVCLKTAAFEQPIVQ